MNLRTLETEELLKITASERRCMNSPLRQALERHTSPHFRIRDQIEAKHGLVSLLHVYSHVRRTIEEEEVDDVVNSDTYLPKIINLAESYREIALHGIAHNDIAAASLTESGGPGTRFCSALEEFIELGPSPAAFARLWRMVSILASAMEDVRWRDMMYMGVAWPRQLDDAIAKGRVQPHAPFRIPDSQYELLFSDELRERHCPFSRFSYSLQDERVSELISALWKMYLLCGEFITKHATAYPHTMIETGLHDLCKMKWFEAPSWVGGEFWPGMEPGEYQMALDLWSQLGNEPRAESAVAAGELPDLTFAEAAVRAFGCYFQAIDKINAPGPISAILYRALLIRSEWMVSKVIR